VMPHFDLGVMWDDNIFIQADNEIEDFLFTFSPGLTVGYLDEESRLERFLEREVRASRAVQYDGNFFLLDYTPSFVVFLDNDSENSFDQDARFEARWQWQKLSLAAQAAFVSRNETNNELGTRLRHTGVTAGLAARYQFSERTSLEVGGYFQSDDYEEASGNTEYRAETYLNYELTPLIDLGVGAAFGLVDVENAPQQTFERLLARGSYELTGKVTVRAQAGVEFRQYDAGGDDQTNPVFEFDIAYEPAELTRIGVGAYRRVIPSISEPSDSVEASGVVLTFGRTLRAGLRLAAEAGFEHAEYGDNGVGSARSDDYFYGRVGLTYNFATWGSAGVGYEYRNNDSSRSASGFTNNRITLDVSLTF
jgi:Putative beta-barrel porin 2